MENQLQYLKEQLKKIKDKTIAKAIKEKIKLLENNIIVNKDGK